MIAAIDLNGSVVETTGHSTQTAIIALISVATVLAVCAYSLLCKGEKEEEDYELFV